VKWRECGLGKSSTRGNVGKENGREDGWGSFSGKNMSIRISGGKE